MSSGRLVKAITGVAGVILLSRCLGFIREIVIAGEFGTSADYDTYLIAIMLPALMYGIVNQASFYLFVPFLSKRLFNDSAPTEETNWRDFWGLVNAAFVTAILLCLSIIIVAPYVMNIWAGKFSAEVFSLVIFYTRLTAVVVILGTSEALMRAYLNARKVYTSPAWGFIVFNLVSISAIVFLHRSLGTGALAAAWMGGLTAQNIYLTAVITRIRKPRKYQAVWLTNASRTLLVTSGLLIAIELINRSYFLIDRYFAPQFGAGIVAALNYCQVLIQLPDSVIGFAYGAVLFPIFSNTAATTDYKRFAGLYIKTITSALFIGVPLAVFFYINAPDLIRLIFLRGAFDAHSVELTTNILRPLTPSLPALFIISASVRACYAYNWVKAVLLFTVILFAAKFLATILLPQIFGYPGISAATSMSLVSFAILLLLLVMRKGKFEQSRKFAFLLIRIVLAGIVSAFSVMYLIKLLPDSLQSLHFVITIARLTISGLVLVIIYAMVSWLFGLRHFLGELIIPLVKTEKQNNS